AAHARDAHRQRVADAEVTHASDGKLIERTIRHAQRPGAIAIRLGAEKLDRAADGVLARQGPLRTAQDLDAFQVDQLKQRAGERRDVAIINVHAHAGIERIVEVHLADAADERDKARTAILRLG